MKKRTYTPPKILEVTTEPLMLGINNSGGKTKPELSDSKEYEPTFDDMPSNDASSNNGDVWQENE
ncbi:MAG: hypothetical protein PUF37_00905 [Prevotellaceae bacterium]|nr:hypothetical protein [Prevotellaceae bacterium]